MGFLTILFFVGRVIRVFEPLLLNPIFGVRFG